MSSDPKNTITLIGGLVDAPEVFNDKVAKFRIAVDYAGQDSDNPENRSGFFVGKYFLGGDDFNGKFVKGQIDAGNFKKGSQVALVGRLSHSRYTDKNENRRSDVEIIIDSMTFVGRREDNEGGEGTPTAAPAAAKNIPDF